MPACVSVCVCVCLYISGNGGGGGVEVLYLGLGVLVSHVTVTDAVVFVCIFNVFLWGNSRY